MLEGLQKLYAAGAEVDWAGFDGPFARRRVAAPSYPLRATRHWMDVVNQAPGMALNAGQRWAALSQALDRQAERGPLDLGIASYPAKWACLEGITLAHAAHTLREAGLFREAGESRTLDEVLQAGGIAAGYRHLVARWLAGLAARGDLRARGEAFVADAPLAEPDLPALWTGAQALFADNQPLFDYLRHCGSLVEPVLRGRESPLETLFPGGSFELAENLYQRSATAFIGRPAATFESGPSPPGRQLRVLRSAPAPRHQRRGAGRAAARSRATTSATCPTCPRPRALREHRFLSFGAFDMDQDPAAQGYAPGASTPSSPPPRCTRADLRTALQRLRGLLAPAACWFWWIHHPPGVVRHEHRPDRRLAALRRPAHRQPAAAARHLGVRPARGRLRRGRRSAARGLARRGPGPAPSRRAPGSAEAAGGVTQAIGPAGAPAARPRAPGRRKRPRRCGGGCGGLPGERLTLREFVRDRVVRVLRLIRTSRQGGTIG